jgi:hypothetical protein
LRHTLNGSFEKLKHALLSTQYFSFNTLSKVKRNAADDNSDHSAATNADREVYVKTVPFTRTYLIIMNCYGSFDCCDTVYWFID